MSMFDKKKSYLDDDDTIHIPTRVEEQDCIKDQNPSGLVVM